MGAAGNRSMPGLVVVAMLLGAATVTRAADPGGERGGEGPGTASAGLEVMADMPRPAVARIQVRERRSWITHRVVPRETLAQIAARYEVTVDALRKWNEALSDTPKKRDKIKIRARRDVPARHRVDHVVRQGDTWWSIAVAHGVDSRDLRAYNWRKSGQLREGENLAVWVDPVVFSTILAERDAPPWGVRPGGVSVGTANEGRIVNAVELPESDLYVRKIPRSAYGTTNTIRSLVAGLTAFRESSPYGGRVYISAISRPRGGELGHHKSHQSGRDVDIRLPLKEEIPQALSPKPARRVDWLATYQLIRALVDTEQVVYVFLDYKLQRRMYRAAEAAGVEQEELDWMMQWPRGSRASRGMVRDSPGHDDHFHVRFRCGIEETECVALVPEGRPLGLYDEEPAPGN